MIPCITHVSSNDFNIHQAYQATAYDHRVAPITGDSDLFSALGLRNCFCALEPLLKWGSPNDLCRKERSEYVCVISAGSIERMWQGEAKGGIADVGMIRYIYASSVPGRNVRAGQSLF